MTTAALKARDLKRDRFLDCIENLDVPDAALSLRVWMEAADGWALDWWPGPEHDLHWCTAGREPATVRSRDCLARSTAGRLFAPDGELRWRVIPALGETCIRTVFLGNTDWVHTALEDCSDQLNGLQPTRHRFFLWGKQTGATPGEWIELRVPHRFRYPVSGPCLNVKVLVEQWCDGVGEPHFFRLCDLEPDGGQPDA